MGTNAEKKSGRFLEKDGVRVIRVNSFISILEASIVFLISHLSNIVGAATSFQ